MTVGNVKPVISLLLLLITGTVRADTAPDFTLPRLDNQQPVSLSSLHGRVVYVDFWASWCAPCALSLPALQTLHSELQVQGFEVIAINLDESPQQAQRFLQPLHITYPVVFDAQKHTPQAYNISGMPTAFLVDRSGRVRSRHTGFRSGDETRLRQQIQQLLQESSP